VVDDDEVEEEGNVAVVTNCGPAGYVSATLVELLSAKPRNKMSERLIGFEINRCLGGGSNKVQFFDGHVVHNVVNKTPSDENVQRMKSGHPLVFFVTLIDHFILIIVDLQLHLFTKKIRIFDSLSDKQQLGLDRLIAVGGRSYTTGDFIDSLRQLLDEGFPENVHLQPYMKCRQQPNLFDCGFECLQAAKEISEMEFCRGDSEEIERRQIHEHILSSKPKPSQGTAQQWRKDAHKHLQDALFPGDS
jgi:hypothetical protein